MLLLQPGQWQIYLSFLEPEEQPEWLLKLPYRHAGQVAE